VKDGFLTVDQGIGTARGASPSAKLVCKLITSVFLVNFVMSPKGHLPKDLAKFGYKLNMEVIF
jgi:hypothetical protein